MKKWEKYLQVLGINETESKLYLESLKMGPSSVQDIAKKTNLSRVSVYSIVENLTKLGLMTSVEKGKKKFYAVEPPERIITLAEKKDQEMHQAVKEIKNNIQDLKLIQSGDKPIVKMYEGSEVFLAMQEDMLKSRVDQISEFGNLDEIDKVYPYEQLKPLHSKITHLKVKRKIIYQTKNKLKRLDELGKKIKYLNDNVKYFGGDFFLYKDTVWLSSFTGKQITVMIKSQEIKDTLQRAFDILWEAI